MPIFSPKCRYTWVLALALPVLATTSCSAGRGDESVDSTGDDPLSAANNEPHKAVCADAPAGYARCHARVRVTPQGAVKVFAAPSGLTPADLQSAYNLPTSGGSGMTIAIVDAQDNPNAEKDLGVYRQQFGLAPCTTANGCFKKVNQSGQPSPLPTPDTGWAGEIALDLDMASAACPSCKILLVEANSASMSDLGAAVNTAVKMGANVVSNSYGGSEDSSAPTTDEQYFNHPGVTITASSGDGGYGVEYPAASKYVLAVGGTNLTKASNTRGWTEKAWSGAGSGCSQFETKPSFQKDSGCAKRTVADVSAVADPNTGVAVYVTYGGSGWAVYGGTSASSPLVAAILALTGKANVGNSWPYAHTGAFFDVTSGSNGSCGGSYLCTGTTGYDGPTGLGTPNGALIASGGGGGGGGDGGTDSGGGDSGGGSDGGTDSGGGSCAHPICTTGTKLTSGCDPCATKVCASDAYCCATAWDSICVGEVSSICGQSCGGGGGGGGGSCAHPICSTGSKLTSGCDPCATKICAADAYCCSTAWDSICVGEVKSICGETCQ